MNHQNLCSNIGSINHALELPKKEESSLFQLGDDRNHCSAHNSANLQPKVRCTGTDRRAGAGPVRYRYRTDTRYAPAYRFGTGTQFFLIFNFF